MLEYYGAEKYGNIELRTVTYVPLGLSTTAMPG